MKIAQDMTELIGKTPLLEASRFAREMGVEARLLIKLEAMNPAGSVKDRIALGIICQALAEGKIRKGGVLVEPTSGNTGIGLAAVGAVYGLRVILTMPETMSIERRKLLKAYGAEVVLTEGAKGMKGAIERAEQLLTEIPGSFMPGQFKNPVNPKTHERTTGPEIWTDTEGQVDCFVAGVGTGGTITGVGRYLKAQKPDVQVVAIEPKDSPVLSGGKPGPHPLQGIGAGFVPDTLDTEIYDEVIQVTGEDAFKMTQALGKKEGVLVGISAGAALFGGVQWAKRPENQGKTVVILLPDTGDRYLSTALFGE